MNVKLPGLDSMTPEDVKKTIDTVIADTATASAVESKTIRLGMSPYQVKKSLGNPDKIFDLGAKQIYVYKDMKVVSSQQPGFRRSVKVKLDYDDLKDASRSVSR